MNFTTTENILVSYGLVTTIIIPLTKQLNRAQFMLWKLLKSDDLNFLIILIAVQNNWKEAINTPFR